MTSERGLCPGGGADPDRVGAERNTMNSIAQPMRAVKPRVATRTTGDVGEYRARMYQQLLRNGLSRSEAAEAVDASFMTPEQLREHYLDRKTG